MRQGETSQRAKFEQTEDPPFVSEQGSQCEKCNSIGTRSWSVRIL